MKKVWFLSFLSLAFIGALYVGCGDGAGLGEEVDLEAPVINITSLNSGDTELTDFSGSVYCRRNVTFAGTATDNKGVKRVYAELKWAEESSFSYANAATVRDTTWTCDLAFEREGVAIIRFVVEDERGNVSPKSSKTSILFIDEDAPVASAWYIDRRINGIRYNLRDIETLKDIATRLDSAENIDAAQNVAFSLKANVNDTFGVGGVSLKLNDEKGKLVCTIKNTSGNDYAPEFVVTQKDIVDGAAANGLTEDFSTGIHYLQVSYDAQDLVPNLQTDVEVNEGYLIWYPESDIPKITPSQDPTDNVIPLHIKDVLSLSVFDDDELQEAYCALLTEEENANFTVDWSHLEKIEEQITGDTKEKRYKHFTAQTGERDTTVVLFAADSPQDMHLYAYAIESVSKKTITKDYTVRVTDDTQPILLITTPDNNSVPAVTMGNNNTQATVTIKGQSLDSVGCKYLEFVWLPEAEATDSTQRAKNWLNALSDAERAAYQPTGTDKSKKLSGTGEYDGLTLWSVALGEMKASGNFMQQTFEFDIDLFNDFGDERVKSKSFVARLTRDDGKYVYSEYRLLADTVAPTIVPVYPATDMQIIPKSEDLVLEFKAEKASGLAIDPDAYKIFLLVDLETGAVLETPQELTAAGNKAHYDAESGTYKATVLSSLLTDNIKPRFEFRAKDVFGNEGADRYTMVVSNAPLLKSITTTASTSVVHKKGEKIAITATFSNTVSLRSNETVRLKLTNIKNESKNQGESAIVYADYKTGSGSTTLTFEYTVQEGDTSDGIKLVTTKTDNKFTDLFDTADATSFSKNADLTAISDESKLFSTSKVIKLDGIPPKVTNITIATDATETNKHDNVTYLAQGKKITVTVTADDTISVRGAPSFEFTVAGKKLSLPFAGTTANNTVKFETKVVTGYDGALTCSADSCVGFGYIVDSAGNELSTAGATMPTDSITIDTVAPDSPAIKKADGSALVSGKYNTDISFAVTAAEAGNSLAYSTDGGSTWTDYSSAVTLNSSAQLTARATDYAGNQSAPAPTLDLDINGTFPAFTLECTNPDGNYKAGSSLTFKVTFDSKVSIAANAAAYITLSKRADSESIGSDANPGKATLVSSAAQNGVTTAYFAYQIQDPDQFTLLVEENAATLTGITDLYGNAQGSQQNARYERQNVHCDGVAPKVTGMTPQGETTSSSDGAKVYTKGNVITLTFSEEIQRANGKLTLRQVKDWPIPPVLTASDFSTIVAAISTDDKEILSMQNNGIDMEDSESLFQAKVGAANDRYHGTGQYVGPYKKSMQGLTLSGDSYIPDTSVKYVLDFDIDIWETTQTHRIGQTFESGHTSGNSAADAYSRTSSTGNVTVVEPTTTRTAGQIRTVLEKAGYHERVIDVTSSYVTISADQKTVTITFPKGLTGTDALSDGRKWELVIDKGAFMDMTGNYFGAEPNGDLAKSDAVQSATDTLTQTTVTSARGRLQTSTTAPVVLIQNNGKDYFWSDKVATPVVRVDRYSYALGMKQSDSTGTSLTTILTDQDKPTGYVRVRIDCETEGATVKYGTSTTSNSRNDGYQISGTSGEYTDDKGGYYISPDGKKCYSWFTKTTDLTSTALSGVSLNESQANIQSNKIIFAGGNGGYTQSCKEYVVAVAEKTGLTTSGRGVEGVFQTVVRMVTPSMDDGTAVSTLGEGKTDVSIRGTTGFAGEPSIAPFPLRDSQIASPFLRRMYREPTDTVVATPQLISQISKPVSTSNGTWYEWTTKQFLAANEIPSGTKGIKFTVSTKVNGNYGIKATNSDTKYWVDSGASAPVNAALSTTIVNEAKSQGLAVEGQGEFTITCYFYDQKFDSDEALDYYWVAYDILVDTSFSNYCSNGNKYDWGQNWGLMKPGEFTQCINMRRWK